MVVVVVAVVVAVVAAVVVVVVVVVVIVFIVFVVVVVFIYSDILGVYLTYHYPPYHYTCTAQLVVKLHPSSTPFPWKNQRLF